MKPGDYEFAGYPTWNFWSGKSGWSGFAQSSWDWLDVLYKKALDNDEPAIDVLDIGGWDYEITMDLRVDDGTVEPGTCGFQEAKHTNSKNKKRAIMKSW